MRTSESKTIINQELFDVKLPDYQRIIERLVSKYNVVDGSYYEGLVNFKANLVVPKHKWYDYKQGYSELLVKHIIDEAKPLKEHYILDPFCGVGTTNLTSVNRGYKTIGFDVNPMAILTAKAKTHHYTPKEIALIKKYLESFTLPDSKVEIEGGRVIETSFTEDVLDILLKIRFFVDGINNDAVQDFFRLALISIIDKCSLKIKDGNGLKFKKNYKAVPKSRKTKCDGREKRNVIFEAKTKCAQKSRLLPLSSQNTSVVQTPFESCLNDAFLLNFLLKYHLKPIANLAKNRIFT